MNPTITEEPDRPDEPEEADRPIGRTEAQRVFLWRAENLVRAGYDDGAAAAIALRDDVDLHRACELVGQGCPADLAARILL